MKDIKNGECYLCGAPLEKDHIALNRKLIDRELAKFLCLDCLAEHLKCSRADLIAKIKEFKDQGCKLFQ